MVTRRPRYDDKFRASAVVMLQAAGYPDRKGALENVAQATHVPARTLSRWFNGENNPPPDIVVSEKASDLKDLINAELKLIIAEMDKARTDASYKDLGTVFGILVDKKQLIEGKPTDIHDVNVTDAKERLQYLISRQSAAEPTNGDTE